MNEHASTASAGLHDGLDDAEASRLHRLNGPNELPRAREPSIIERALRQLIEPLTALLLVVGIVSIVVLDRSAEGAAILAIVVIDVAIAAHQQRRTASAMRALETLVPAMARVHRSGRPRLVPASELVRGDVVEIAAGDRIPADLDLVDCASLAVDEAMLTGESLPVDKTLADRHGFAGTLVVRGHGIGIVRSIGADTEIGRIAGQLGRTTDTPLTRELRTVAMRMSALALLAGAILVPVVRIRSESDEPMVDALLAGIAMAVAAIPEGMPAIVTTALALGAHRMARKGAIVRDLAAIEAIGAAQVLCIDKTGTLTTGNLAVSSFDARDGGDDALWMAALRSSDSTTADPVDLALIGTARDRGTAGTVGRLLEERPYDPATRSMATVRDVDGDSILTLKGAPEVVLSRCTGGEQVDRLAAAAEDLARAGMKVLAIAEARTTDLTASGLDPLGIIAFADPPRSSAATAVAACRRAGVQLVVATGDHESTARAIAAAVGIPSSPSVNGHHLSHLPPVQRADMLSSASIVARIDPGTKVELVDSHRSLGRIVAMTGDGVNDAPALQRADVGIAIAGSGGTDVARAAAKVIITDGDLGTIVEAIKEGRRIRRNLCSVVDYLVAGNLSEVLVVAIGTILFTDLPVALLPVQLLWVNLVTDGAPALALGMDTASRTVLDGPSPIRRGLLDRPALTRAVLRAAILAALVLATGVAANGAGWTAETVRTQLLLSLLMCHLAFAYAARSAVWAFEAGWSSDRKLAGAIAASMSIQLLVFCTAVGRNALGLAALPPVGWVLAGLSAVASVGALAGLVALSRRSRSLRR